ncbi:hypothetical protein GCM10011607_22770 [Shewanella inventionis]|uniref:Uncharacterized protein n=1 Tax=Shewanella inventionis TaxID=1738770 RepID=A0ABQ1J937_9GAMM|nr:hypothetical protein GCM10011607_22770 [Shewanella inventionis]
MANYYVTLTMINSIVIMADNTTFESIKFIINNMFLLKIEVILGLPIFAG